MKFVRADAKVAVHDALHTHKHPHVLAGGTDLLVQMKSRRLAPDCVIDIKGLSDANRIEVSRQGAFVGAAVSGAQLGDHPEFTRFWPGVSEAAQLIGSTQVQGRATMVGNLCNASPAADTIPALIAANAIAVVSFKEGERRVPAAEIPTGPGQNALQLGEFVLGMEFPDRFPGSSDAYLRFIPRTEMDIAVASAGANIMVNAKGTITQARVAFGAVAAVPYLLEAATDLLVGTKLDNAVLETLAQISQGAANPIDDKRGTVEFRRKVAGVLAVRSVTLAYSRAKETL